MTVLALSSVVIQAENERNDAERELRGEILDKFAHHKEALKNYRENGFLAKKGLHPALDEIGDAVHPLKQHIHNKISEVAQKGADAFRQSLKETQDRIKEGRARIRNRLAAYEEGSSDFNFDLECALESIHGKENCLTVGKESKCTWCNVQDVFGFCTSKADEDVLAQVGIECGSELTDTLEEEELTYENNFSVQCAVSTSHDTCIKTTDEDQQQCNWCQYNSWIGVCISPDDKKSAEDDLFLTCVESSMF